MNGGIPAEIEFSVVPSRAAGDIWIELKHTGENAGVGRVNWSGDIRDERRARQTGIESIGRQVRNLIKDNSRLFSPHTVKDVFSIPVTTLTRLFSSKPAQDTFGYKIEDKEIVLLYPLLSVVPSIEFAINLFCNEGYNVNDIRNDADRKRFVQHIPPELNPSKINKPNNSTTTMGVIILVSPLLVSRREMVSLSQLILMGILMASPRENQLQVVQKVLKQNHHQEQESILFHGL